MEKLTVAKKEEQKYFNVFYVFVIVSIKEQLYKIYDYRETEISISIHRKTLYNKIGKTVIPYYSYIH